MARRVRRVRRTRRVSRTKSTKGVQGAGNVSGSAGGAEVDDDPDGPGGTGFVATHRTLKGKRKGGVGVDGDLDLELMHELEADSGAETDLGVRRKGGAGSDGFDERQNQGREAYDAYLKGQVTADAQRFESLREQGKNDAFDPEAEPSAVERTGQLQSAAHMIRLYDHWTLEGVEREGAIENAASFLSSFSRADNVKKVLTELESKPIRDVYPLEVMLKLIEVAPDKLPGVRTGPLLREAPALTEDRVFAGHAVQIPIPPGVRLKAFALLGGHRPGYEFFPSKTKDDQYTLLIDTPGQWDVAVLGVRTQPLGKMVKEMPGGVIDKFTVNVKEMGRKEAPAGA